MTFKKSEILLVFALKPESEGRPEKLGFKTIYTGVGKVNASIGLMEYLNKDEKLPFKSEAIEMEAFALAKVCYKKSVNFSSLKYISDGADESAENDWPKEVKKAALKFEDILIKMDLN